MALVAALVLTACTGSPGTMPTATTPAATPADERAAAIWSIAGAVYTEHDLVSLIVQVRVDGEVIPEFARAEAMTGGPGHDRRPFRTGR